MMQALKLPPFTSASMGAEGSSSCSGALDVMVKSDAKKSIVVYVVWRLSTMSCEKSLRTPNPFLLYIKFLGKGRPSQEWLRTTFSSSIS